jgi:hypothetical protein
VLSTARIVMEGMTHRSPHKAPRKELPVCVLLPRPASARTLSQAPHHHHHLFLHL